MTKQKSIGIGILVLLLVSMVINLAIGAFWLTDKKSSGLLSVAAKKVDKEIDKNAFQVIYLDTADEKSYIGRLSVLNESYYKITNIYYIEWVEGQENGTLIKRGTEDYKPQDEMVIPITHVLFWENLQNANQWNGALKNSK